MKEKIIRLIKNPMLIIFIIILIFYTPFAIYSPGESRNRGVVTAVGIDKIDGEYEVSLLTFIPTVNQSFEEQKSIISAKGDTVAQAVYKAQIAMGRKVGLFHAKTTIVNEELLKEDVTEHIDYLSRVASLPENTVFVGTNKTAKEVLRLSQQSKSAIGLKLEQIIGYNSENIYITDTSLEAFYKGYYNDTKSSVIGYLCVEKNTEDAQATIEKASMSDDMGSSSSNSSASGEQTSSKTEETLVNCGKSILMKNGKMAKILTASQLNAINLLNKKSKNQVFKINDTVQDDKIVNCVYKIRDKDIFTSAKFENGYPVFCADLTLKLDLVEVQNTGQAKISTDNIELNSETKGKIEIEIKKQFSQAINLLKECGTDILGINKMFFSTDRKQYQNFIKGHDGVDEFIKHVVFRLNIDAEAD